MSCSQTDLDTIGVWSPLHDYSTVPTVSGWRQVTWSNRDDATVEYRTSIKWVHYVAVTSMLPAVHSGCLVYSGSRLLLKCRVRQLLALSVTKWIFLLNFAPKYENLQLLWLLTSLEVWSSIQVCVKNLACIHHTVAHCHFLIEFDYRGITLDGGVSSIGDGHPVAVLSYCTGNYTLHKKPAKHSCHLQINKLVCCSNYRYPV